MNVNAKFDYIISLILSVFLFTASASYSADYTIVQVTDNSDSNTSHQINNSGDIVWVRYDGSDRVIFLYNGSDATQITDNSLYNFSPQINDSGYCQWE